ncbi:MAG: SRPBCC family protein [Solirubrobacteraceae bacterium]
MRVGAAIDISAPAEAVWEHVSDPERYLHFMSGVTRWEVVSDEPRGLGARYRMLFRVGSAEVGGLIEVIEFDECRDLAWTSVTGLDQRGRWRLRERDAGRTRVEMRLSYGVAGAGLFGWLAERIAARTVRGHLERTVQQLKRQVEQEQTRRKAAARRAARARAS